MLSLPLKAEATCWMRFSLWGGEDASQTNPETENPFSFHSFKHAFSSSSFLEQVYTVAPNSASSSTTACLNQHPEKTPRKKRNFRSFQQTPESRYPIQFMQQIESTKKRFCNEGKKKDEPNSTRSSSNESSGSLKGPSRASATAFRVRHCCLLLVLLTFLS